MPDIRSMTFLPHPAPAALLPVPALQVLPQPVVLRSENLGPARGLPSIRTAATSLSMPRRAPGDGGARPGTSSRPAAGHLDSTRTRHATHALHGAAFRNLYVDDAPDLGLPALCTSYAVSPLMRG